MDTTVFSSASFEGAYVGKNIYQPLLESYQKLFTHYGKPVRIINPNKRNCNAGYLVKQGLPPLFVAHSLLDAVWLLQQSLPEDSVTDQIWQQLTKAEEEEKEEGEEEEEGREREKEEKEEKKKNSKGSNRKPVTTTVSNHNQTVEKRQKQRAEVQRSKKKEDLGLVQPATTANPKEHAAYQSITPQDCSVYSWIFLQSYKDGSTFYQEAKTPYTLAVTMIKKARVLGN
ncbi:hypothetical protein BU25DRAFT_353146, partial [Macroventuria anomochaeta]